MTTDKQSDVHASPALANSTKNKQLAIAIGTLAFAAFLAWGATSLSANAGYAGVGSNFLPWVVAIGLGFCGIAMLWQVLTGGFRVFEDQSEANPANWQALIWVVIGIFLNATLIEHAGFILSCALCYTCAVRGMRIGQGVAGFDAKRILMDFVTGLAIAAPVYWLFTKLLTVNLPGLTSTGWL